MGEEALRCLFKHYYFVIIINVIIIGTVITAIIVIVIKTLKGLVNVNDMLSFLMKTGT